MLQTPSLQQLLFSSHSCTHTCTPAASSGSLLQLPSSAWGCKTQTHLCPPPLHFGRCFWKPPAAGCSFPQQTASKAPRRFPAPLLNPCSSGDPCTSLGSQSQGLTTLLEKFFFLISNLDLTWCDLRAILPTGRRDQTPPGHNLVSGSCREGRKSPLNLLFSRVSPTTEVDSKFDSPPKEIKISPGSHTTPEFLYFNPYCDFCFMKAKEAKKKQAWG